MSRLWASSTTEVFGEYSILFYRAQSVSFLWDCLPTCSNLMNRLSCSSFGRASSKQELFFTGVVHASEYVNLVREPRNPYDCNAIRVDNLHGDQAGAE